MITTKWAWRVEVVEDPEVIARLGREAMTVEGLDRVMESLLDLENTMGVHPPADVRLDFSPWGVVETVEMITRTWNALRAARR